MEEKQLPYIRIGDVYRNKNDEQQKVVIISVNGNSNQVFVSGVVDMVDPEWTVEYLIANYDLDKKYSTDNAKFHF